MQNLTPCYFSFFFDKFTILQYKLDFSGLSGRVASGSSRDDEGGSGGQGDSKGTTFGSTDQQG